MCVDTFLGGLNEKNNLKILYLATFLDLNPSNAVVELGPAPQGRFLAAPVEMEVLLCISIGIPTAFPCAPDHTLGC